MTPPLAVCAACAVGERGPPDGLHLSQHQPGASSHFHLHVPLSVSVKIIIVSKGIIIIDYTTKPQTLIIIESNVKLIVIFGISHIPWHT